MAESKETEEADKDEEKPRPGRFVDKDAGHIKTFETQEEYEEYCKENGLPIYSDEEE